MKSCRLMDDCCSGSHIAALTAVNRRFLARLLSGSAMAILHCSIVVTRVLKDKTSCDLNSLSFIYQHK